jgi:hypothetical protein
MKRTIVLPALISVFVALSPAGVALADNPHATPGTAGQPDKTASENPDLKPPGFSTAGFENAESHYAGEEGTASLAHSNSVHAVSQYDVAGFQWERHH